MKLDCHIVSDLLAEYAEGLVSEKTAADVSEHLKECGACSKKYADMTAPISKDTFEPEKGNAENVENVEYLKKYHKSRKVLIVTVCVLGAAAVLFAALLATVACASYMFIGSAEKSSTEDISQYEELLGENGEYRTTYFGTDEIFPEMIPESAETEEFVCDYYDPFDPNILCSLVYTCSDEDFEREYNRLKTFDSTEDYKVYGIKSFPYELCAVKADKYYGITYALADKSCNKLIYFKLNFCNFFTDIDYEKKVNNEYLPKGFDAKPGNATRKAFDRGEIEL